MADRVHPIETTTPSETSPDKAEFQQPKPGKPSPSPASGTYIIQVPRDQIYRVPPAGKSQKNNARRNKPRRSFCRPCFYYTLSTLLLVILLLSITAGILYLVFRPKAPKYSIDTISIGGISVTTSSSLLISPVIDVAIRAHNTNGKLAIHYYKEESSVDVYYSAVKLATGVLPTFDQQPHNLTVIQTTLTGSNIALGNADHTALVNQQRQGDVPLKVRLRVPVKIKVGAVKTWKIFVKVNCDLTVDKLTTDSNVLAKKCDYSVKLW